MVKELKDLLKEEAEQQGKEFELEWARTLSDLGYTVKGAIQKLKEAGIVIVFTESEKEETFDTSGYDLFCLEATPSANTITC